MNQARAADDQPAPADNNETTPLLTGGDEESQYYRYDELTKWELKAWDDEKRWFRVAKKKKEEEIYYRKMKLALSVGGVLLQTLSSQIQDGKLLIGNVKILLPNFLGFAVYIRRVCAFLGGILLLLIPYVNDNLTSEKIADRADSRLVSEELKSEIWKSLSGIQQYKSRSQDAVIIFNKNIQKVIEKEAGIDEPRYSIHPICNLPFDETEGNLKLEAKEQMPKFTDYMDEFNSSSNKNSSELKPEHKNEDAEMKARKKLYLNERVDYYLRNRKKHAKKMDGLADYWHKVEMYLTIGSAVIGILLNYADAENDLAIWATVITTAAAAVASHITACRFDANRNSLYGVALLLENLKREREQNINETDEEWDIFVNKFEETMLSQTRKWRVNTVEASKLKKEDEDDQNENSNHS